MNSKSGTQLADWTAKNHHIVDRSRHRVSRSEILSDRQTPKPEHEPEGLLVNYPELRNQWSRCGGQHHWFSADSLTIELESVPNRRSQRPIGPFADPDHENCHPFFWIIRRDDR